MTETEKRKDKRLASFKLSEICNLFIQTVSQVWAVVGTAVPELKHTLHSHNTLQVTLHLHCPASFKTDECYVRAGLLRTKQQASEFS